MDFSTRAVALVFALTPAAVSYGAGGKGQVAREKGYQSLPVVAMGSIPHIWPACGFPTLGGARGIAPKRGG